MPQNYRSIKTGIIGYGYAGRIIHQQLIQATDGLELRAVSTSNPDRQTEAERNNLIVYQNPQELIADPAIESTLEKLVWKSQESSNPTYILTAFHNQGGGEVQGPKAAEY